MKTWNEIEAGLKADPGVEPPAGLHDRILRAVRDDRAATARTTAPRHYVSLWLMAGATVAALGAMTSVLLFSPAPPAPLLLHQPGEIFARTLPPGVAPSGLAAAGLASGRVPVSRQFCKAHSSRTVQVSRFAEKGRGHREKRPHRPLFHR